MAKVAEFITKKNRKIEIIEPSLDRLDDILELANKFAKEDAHLSFHPGKTITRVEEEAWLKGRIKAIENGSSLLYWPVFEGKIIGSVDVNRGNSVRDWHVGTMGIMIDQDFRGEGLGKFLMEFIFDKAREAGIRTVDLRVFSDNLPARNLYKKMGMKEYGALPDGLYRQGKFSDSILMYKQLL